MNTYRQAKDFTKSLKLKKNYSYDYLKTEARKFGYDVYEFDILLNTDVALFQNLDTENLAYTQNSFTYNKNGLKTIFIRRNLSEEDKKIVLFHELIHIHGGYIGKEVLPSEEKQVTDIHFLADFILKNRKYIILIITEIALLIFMLIYNWVTYMDYVEMKTKRLYITPTGSHYHRYFCGEVYNNPSANQVSVDYARKNYLPCSNCNPDKK